jgi:hypothetical protein
MSTFAWHSFLPEERCDEHLEGDCEEAAVLHKLAASSFTLAGFGTSADDTSTLPAKIM